MVGSYESGKSPYGCYDMVGNVLEWCNTWYEEFICGKTKRVIRGGSWHRFPDHCYSFHRNACNPRHSSPDIGFRCVRDVK